MTALMLAVWVRNFDMVNTLLRFEAYPDLRDPQGETALIKMALRGGHLNITEALVNAGATLDLEDSSGMTAFDHAVERGHVNIYVHLMKSGTGGFRGLLCRNRIASCLAHEPIFKVGFF